MWTVSPKLYGGWTVDREPTPILSGCAPCKCRLPVAGQAALPRPRRFCVWQYLAPHGQFWCSARSSRHAMCGLVARWPLRQIEGGLAGGGGALAYKTTAANHNPEDNLGFLDRAVHEWEGL